MRIAFVGVKRKYSELPSGYAFDFTRFHLELPFYYAKDGKNDVDVTTVDEPEQDTDGDFFGGGSLSHPQERIFKADLKLSKPDVVIHWRKWYEDLYVQGAINIINCQDHSFDNEWQYKASTAFKEGKLYGILCFPTWHKRNLLKECPWLPDDHAIDGLTLGVDTDVYKPAENKDFHQMLWASDPGRGLMGALNLAAELYKRDRRFHLHVCFPDYATSWNNFSLNQPFVTIHRNLQNGPKLWNLFNETGILPYTSTFMEPSSRSHRQAQAAGSLVLYPPNMGSPSELICSDSDGIVEAPYMWADTIIAGIETGRHLRIAKGARETALSENWAVQAQRFNKFFEGIIGGEKR